MHALVGGRHFPRQRRAGVPPQPRGQARRGPVPQGRPCDCALRRGQGAGHRGGRPPAQDPAPGGAGRPGASVCQLRAHGDTSGRKMRLAAGMETLQQIDSIDGPFMAAPRARRPGRAGRRGQGALDEACAYWRRSSSNPARCAICHGRRSPQARGLGRTIGLRLVTFGLHNRQRPSPQLLDCQPA